MEQRDIPKVYDTPKGRRLYSWLRRSPPLVRVVAVDEAEQEITVSLERREGQGSPKWKDAIGALYDCVKMRGLNAAGEVVRTLSFDPDADPALATRIDSHEAMNAARQHARETGSTLIAVDVPKLVESIAKNMQEVAKTAAEQNSAAFAKGFEAMTDVVQLCIGMLQRVDQRVAELEESRPEPPEPPAEPEGDARGQLAIDALIKSLAPGLGAASSGGVNAAQAAQIQALLGQFLSGGTPPAPTEPNGHAGQ
ncbi:MAG TPA: hypothetical protein VL131_05945 [Gammaproteobacteria bacterium]|nr:hypothetical protein [Gammaproteobacteria bacterium]